MRYLDFCTWCSNLLFSLLLEKRANNEKSFIGLGPFVRLKFSKKIYLTIVQASPKHNCSNERKRGSMIPEVFQAPDEIGSGDGNYLLNVKVRKSSIP